MSNFTERWKAHGKVFLQLTQHRRGFSRPSDKQLESAALFFYSLGAEDGIATVERLVAAPTWQSGLPQLPMDDAANDAARAAAHESLRQVVEKTHEVFVTGVPPEVPGKGCIRLMPAPGALDSYLQMLEADADAKGDPAYATWVGKLIATARRAQMKAVK